MKTKNLMSISVVLILALSTNIFAQLGDMGVFGGISEGSRLPKTTELILAETSTSRRTEEKEMQYKELVFLSGKPVEFEGTLIVKTSGDVNLTKDVGTFTETYTVEPSAATSDTIIDREMTFTTNYRKVSGTNQIIKDSEIANTNRGWQETIIIDEVTYSLDRRQSYFNRSVIEDHTPGVVYYKGNISQKAVYIAGENDTVTVESSGTIYGYECAWSKTETHRLDVYVEGVQGEEKWQLEVQIRPSVSVNKNLQYSQNEPTAISFDGNYYEVISNQSGLNYDIYVLPREFEREVNRTGSLSINTNRTFEQLPAPDLAFLKGHFAEGDIKKLFSMQILEGEPKQYQPNQAITRGQLVTALVKAIKLPVEQPKKTSSRSTSKTKINYLFPDVTDQRDDYRYIQAAYNSKLAVGKSDGLFKPDEPIDRQEAITILLRTLGLVNLGLDPTPITVFTDDSNIAPWAKREIYAATRIGIVAGDLDGKFRPRDKVSKAEAAALINRLVNYMRAGISIDYIENIVDFPK